jgi:hypothetical protein
MPNHIRVAGYANATFVGCEVDWSIGLHFFFNSKRKKNIQQKSTPAKKRDSRSKKTSTKTKKTKNANPFF